MVKLAKYLKSKRRTMSATTDEIWKKLMLAMNMPRGMGLLRFVIQDRRERLGWPRSRAYHQCGMTRDQYIAIEKSRVYITPEELELLAVGLGLEKNWLSYVAGFVDHE